MVAPANQSQPFDIPGPAGTPPKKYLLWPWLTAIGVLAVVYFGVLIANSSNTGQFKPVNSTLKATVVSCSFTGGDLPMATVGFTITNNSTVTRNATVHIEYRDLAGSRIDTDTSYVRNIAPGDTVRTEESTLLNASADHGTCGIALS